MGSSGLAASTSKTFGHLDTYGRIEKTKAYERQST